MSKQPSDASQGAKKPDPANPEQTSSDKKLVAKHEAEYWANLFLAEFEKETDRAAVIVAASLFDDALSSLLRHSLVPNASSVDELMDGANAPIGTFSAKILLVIIPSRQVIYEAWK